MKNLLLKERISPYAPEAKALCAVEGGQLCLKLQEGAPCLTLLDSGLQMSVYIIVSQGLVYKCEFPGTTHFHSDSLSLV